MPRPAAPPAAIDPRKAAQAQQDLAMAGLGDFDLPRTTVTRLARSQVSGHIVIYVYRRDGVAHTSVDINVWFAGSALLERQVGDSAKLSQDVISALIKSSTVFINYLGQSPALSSI
jgi:hypothetical protein